VGWRSALKSDPLPWLLEPDDPSVRYFALRDLLGRSEDDPEVQAARAAIMESEPVSAILAARNPDGYWVKPGHGYYPKYTGTVWQVMLLADLGADGADRRIRQSCDYLLSQCQCRSGGLSHNATPSGVIHCLTGNLTHAFLALGLPAEDERIQQALDWQAGAILGEEATYYKSGTTGADFGCAYNSALPCAWGAIKALKALSLLPLKAHTPRVARAIDAGVDFLFSRDLARADYPHYERVSSSWFKFGYPLSYTSDILEALEVLARLGHARDPRLSNAIESMLSKQDSEGRWKLERTLNGKTWIDIEKKGQPSKWVTLRALRVPSVDEPSQSVQSRYRERNKP
jgi:hypothetical protein